MKKCSCFAKEKLEFLKMLILSQKCFNFRQFFVFKKMFKSLKNYSHFYKKSKKLIKSFNFFKNVHFKNVFLFSEKINIKMAKNVRDKNHPLHLTSPLQRLVNGLAQSRTPYDMYYDMCLCIL